MNSPRRFDDHKPRTPPPDLPSLLLDSRICYLGERLVLRSSLPHSGFPCPWPTQRQSTRVI